jgi:dUTP pyrophosphatase
VNDAARPVVRFVRLRPDAVAPVQMTAGAAGFDLAACLGDAAVLLAPAQRECVATGLALAIPPGYEGQVRPRSGWAVRAGVTVLNAPGTIDADYRGELLVLLVNLGSEPVEIRHGDRIAQLVIAPVVAATFECVFGFAEASGEPGRGSGGFGSTGR